MTQSPDHSPYNTQHASDSRLKYLDREMARHSYAKSGLVEVLFRANGLFGYLSEDILRYIARSLNIAPSRVYAAATFYSRFNLHPQQDARVRLCGGLSCRMNGSERLAAAVADAETPAEVVPCTGMCGHGPVVRVDDTTLLEATADAVRLALGEPEGERA